MNELFVSVHDAFDRASIRKEELQSLEVIEVARGELDNGDLQVEGGGQEAGGRAEGL